jgi:predicted alpha/beta-hydrolase family hydrolase
MLIDGPANGWATIVLAHGAGAPMDTPFMTTVAQGLAAGGLRVVRFEFPYMAKRRIDGKRRGPDRMPALLECWSDILAGLAPAPGPVLIGGKSMGGRAAAMFAADPANEGRADAVACLGYPFHPPGKPERTRLEPLTNALTPVLVVQGERDTFGNRADIAGYALSATIELAWIEDGDHSFVPRKSSGQTETGNLVHAVEQVHAFAERSAGASRPGT